MRELARIAWHVAALELEHDLPIANRRAHEDDLGSAESRESQQRLRDPVIAGFGLDEDRVARELRGRIEHRGNDPARAQMFANRQQRQTARIDTRGHVRGASHRKCGS